MVLFSRFGLAGLLGFSSFVTFGLRGFVWFTDFACGVWFC